MADTTKTTVPAGAYAGELTDPFTAMLAYRRGLYSPIQPPERDLASEAQLKLTIIKELGSLEERINTYRMGVMDSLDKQTETAVKGYADSVAAYAKVLEAVAMGQQAKAAGMDAVLRDDAKNSSLISYRTPNAEAVKAALPTMQTVQQSISTNALKPEGQAGLQAVMRETGGQLIDSTGQVHPAFQAWFDNVGGKELVRAAQDGANQLDRAQSGTRAWTVETLGTYGVDAATTALRGSLDAQALGIDPMQLEGAIQGAAGSVYRRAVEPYQGEFGPAEDMVRRAMDTRATYYQDVQRLGVSGKEGADILHAGYTLFNERAKLPSDYAKTIAAIDEPAHFTALRKMLLDEYNSVGATGDADKDPILRATARLGGRPEFAAWMEAMRFRGPDAAQRAAFYIGSHPGEFTAFVKATQEDPSLLTTGDRARAWIKSVAAERGFGWYSTPAGRAFQLSRPGHKEDLSEPARELDYSDPTLPEATASPDAATTPTEAEAAPRILEGEGGYAYRVEDDGGFTIVKSPRLRPGEEVTVPVGGPGWAAIRNQLLSTHGAEAATPSAGAMVDVAESSNVSTSDLAPPKARAPAKPTNASVPAPSAAPAPGEAAAVGTTPAAVRPTIAPPATDTRPKAAEPPPPGAPAEPGESENPMPEDPYGESQATRMRRDPTGAALAALAARPPMPVRRG